MSFSIFFAAVRSPVPSQPSLLRTDIGLGRIPVDGHFLVEHSLLFKRKGKSAIDLIAPCVLRPAVLKKKPRAFLSDREVRFSPTLMSLLSPDTAAGSITKEELGSDEVCLPEHCFHAFDALYCALTDATPIDPAFPNHKYPLFVTWNTRSYRAGRSSRLRGCIGSFEALHLHDGLAEYALISAFRDSRFRKIDKSELETLECGISLLTDFEDAESYLDWTVGVHGIYISFPHPSLLSGSSSETPSPLSSSPFLPRITSKQTFTATYLPDVIPDQGWTKVEAVDSAINKAGWTGRITEDLRRSVKLRRYQSKKCMVAWSEYIQWRENEGRQ